MSADSARSSPTPEPSRKRRRWRYVLLGLLLIPLLAVTLIIALPNLALRWGMEEGLTLLGMKGNLDHAEIEVGKGLIRIRGFQSTDIHTPIDLGSLDLRFRWKPLLSRQISLERLALTGLNLTAEYRADGSLVISGVPFPATSGNDSAAQSPWGVDAGSIVVTNSRVTLRHGDQSTIVEIDSLRLAGLNSRRPDQVSAWRFLGRINGQNFDIHGNGTPLADVPGYALRVNSKTIDLQAFEALLAPFGVQRMRGRATLDLSLNGDILSLPRIGGSAELHQADIIAHEQALTADYLIWQGQFSSLTTLHNEGSLHARDIRIRYGSNPDHRSRLNAKEILWTGQILQGAENTEDGGLTVTGALGARGLEMDHQNDHLSAQAISWQGTIRQTDDLNLSGDLRSQGLSLRHQDQQSLTAARAGWSGQIYWHADPALLVMDGESQLDEAVLSAPPYTAGAGRLHVRGRLQRDNDDLQFHGQAAVHALRASRPDLTAALDSVQVNIPQLTLRNDGNLESSAQLKASALNVNAYGMSARVKEAEIAADTMNYSVGSDHIDWVGSMRVREQSAKSGTLSLDQAQMDWNGAMAVYLTPKDRELQRGEGVYTGHDIRLRAGAVDVSIKESRAEGTFSRKIPRNASESPLALKLSADAKDLWIRERKRDWLHSERITAKKLELRPGNGLFIRDITLTDPKLLGRRLGKRGLSYPWRLEAEKARISDFDITHKDGFRIGEIILTSAIARITRGDLGRGTQGIMGLEIFQPSPSAKSGATPQPPVKKNTDDEGESVRLAISRLSLDGDSRVEFTDQTPGSGMVRVNLREVQANLTNLTNVDPERSLGFRLNARVGSGYLSASGRTTPFLTPPDFEIHTSLRAYNLIALSPYLADALGVHLHTGQINAAVSLTALTGILKGQADLNLRRLEMDPPDPDAPLVKSTNLPVEAIVSWLKDSRGNIHLSIPISGDLYSPDINLDQTISTAVGGAIRDTLSGTLRVVAFPLAVIVGFFEHLGEEDPHLQTILFPAGETTLTEIAKAQLDSVAKAAHARPNDPLIVCSFAQADVDWPPLFAATQSSPMEKWLERALLARPADAPPLRADTPDIGLLQTLADRRGIAVNAELVATYKLDAEQRIACRARVDDQGPRVEVGF